jgi:hypothetical protein
LNFNIEFSSVEQYACSFGQEGDMDIFRIRTKLVLWLVPVFAILFLAGSAGAEGLFGIGLPGLPSFGGFAGAPAGCGETLYAKTGTLSMYAGWMEHREGTRFTVDGGNADVFGVISVQQQYPNRGLWLGVSDTVVLGDGLSVIASSWYLVPSSVPAREDIVQLGASSSRSWQTDNRWWFADGLFALGRPGGLSALAGLRTIILQPVLRVPMTRSSEALTPVLMLFRQRGFRYSALNTGMPVHRAA